MFALCPDREGVASWVLKCSSYPSTEQICKTWSFKCFFVALMSLTLLRLQVLTLSFPAPNPVEKAPHSACSLIVLLNLVFNPMTFTSLLICEIIPTNQIFLLWELKGTGLSWDLQSLLSTAPAGLVHSQMQLLWLLNGVWCPFLQLWVRVMSKPLSVSPVQRRVMCSLLLHNLGLVDSFPPMG